MFDCFRGLLLPLGIAAAVLTTSPAFAAQRTFVASTGSDANPCSVAAPCRQFSAALAQTNAGGEIVVLDSAGYGPVAITKSVSILAPRGVYAGVSVFAGTGIDIAAPGVSVVLKGLSINGQGGAIGISMTAGTRLTVEDCSITGMSSQGIKIANGVVALLSNVVIERNNARGLWVTDGATVTVSRSSVSHNPGTGIYVDAANGAKTRATIDDTIVNHNAVGVRLEVGNAVGDTGNGLAWTSINRSQVSTNVSGVQVVGFSSNNVALAYLNDSAVTGNFASGTLVANPGAYLVASNNVIAGNNTGYDVCCNAGIYTMLNNVVRDNTINKDVNQPGYIATLQFD